MDRNLNGWIDYLTGANGFTLSPASQRQLRGMLQELVELRAERHAVHLIGGMWEQGGGAEPCGYVTTVDGEMVPLRVDASPVVDEALRRQAAAACKRIELSDPLGVELGAVLALVPAEWHLDVGPAPPRVDYGGQIHAMWVRGSAGHEAWAPTREAAILAATRKLLGLSEDELRRRVSGSPADVVRAAINLVDAPSGAAGQLAGRQLIDAVERLRGSTAAEPRRTCETCEHWDRKGEPAKSGAAVARHCSLVDGWRHPDGWCDDHSAAGEADTDPAPGSGEPLPGVSVEGNVVRSEGDGDA